MARALTELRFGRWRTQLTYAVTLGTGLIVGSPTAVQAQGARPIEFSEPRGGSTNAPDPGASRSRLDALESQISKSFDFLNSDQSLEGAQAPMPHVPSRTPAPRPPRQKPGLFDDDEEWVRSDPLREPDAESDGSERSRSSRTPRAVAGSGSNKGQWLDPSALGDEFWQLNASADAPPNSLLLPDQEELVKIAPKAEPFLESLFGLERRSDTPGVADFEQFDPFNRSWDPAARRGNMSHQEQYRELLGLETPAGAEAAASLSFRQGTTSGWSSQPTRASTWAASPWSSPTTRSLNPVQLAEDRPLLPLTPAAPERPSVQSFYDWEPGATPAVPSALPTTSPFQSPVRRGFP